MEIITGRLEKGRGLASKLGFPTINLSYDGKESGVYAGYFVLSGERLRAAIHLGPRPTVNDERRVCELFLLDGVVMVEDGEYEVVLVEKVREVMKFESLEQLKEQVNNDIKRIKILL